MTDQKEKLSLFDGWEGIFPGLGALACLAAAGTLVVEMATNEPGTLAAIGAVTAVLLVLRGVFQLRDRGGS